MDPMKQNDIQETIVSDPVTNEVLTAEKITEWKENDKYLKPIAGRYPWGSMNTEDLEPKELENPVYADDMADGVRLADPDKDDFVVDIDTKDGKAIHLEPVQERQAEVMAVEKCTEWMKKNPNYTMDELKKAKKIFLDKARQEVLNTHAKHAE